MSRRSGNTIATISTALILLFLLLGEKWILYIALAVNVITILSARVENLLITLWTEFFEKTGRVISSIILCVVFLFVLWPVSLLSRLFRKDPLMLSDKYESYFADREKKDFDRESFHKMW